MESKKMSATIYAHYIKKTASFECEIIDDEDDRYIGGFNEKSINKVNDYSKSSGMRVIYCNYKFDRNLGLIAN